MKNKFRFLPKEERKKILLLSDDIRLSSGVGTMGKEIVLGTAHHFNWLNLGAATKHPEEGKLLDISNDVNKITGLDDSEVRIIPYSGYGNSTILRQLMREEKPDAIVIFTDPRYWEWLFDIEREIRSKIPIFYLNIWDNYPAPYYNKSYYNSVDVLMAISKQTKNINEIVLGEDARDKIIEYLPHGINPKNFFPIDQKHPDYNDFIKLKGSIFDNKDIEFVVFFNSRNIRRKNIIDTIFAYNLFCEKIGKEKAKKCAFLLHTTPIDSNGTDLFKVKETFCDPEYVNIFFSGKILSTTEINVFYNLSDVTILLSNNEGWGLSLTESMMVGKMIICNVTGGMQDQCRFVDETGKWIDFSSNFPSNHTCTFKECGEWAIPVFPNSRSLVGSPPTPYIFEDRVDIEHAANAILKVYNMSKEERARRGSLGREWVLSEESGMNSETMCNNFIKICNQGFEKFVPRSKYDFFKVSDQQKFTPKHKIFNYSYE